MCVNNVDQRLLTILAHPDDEASGFGGILHHFKDTSKLITLTKGEKGTNEFCQLPEAELASKRVVELADSRNTLGLKDNLILDFPDSNLAAFESDLMKLFEELIDKYNPLAVMSMHPDATHHPDHQIIGRCLLSLEKRPPLLFQYKQGRLPQLSPVVINESSTPSLNDFLSQKAVEFKLTPESYQIKREALKCHITQTPDVRRILDTMVESEFFAVIK